MSAVFPPAFSLHRALNLASPAPAQNGDDPDNIFSMTAFRNVILGPRAGGPTLSPNTSRASWGSPGGSSHSLIGPPGTSAFVPQPPSNMPHAGASPPPPQSRPSLGLPPALLDQSTTVRPPAPHGRAPVPFASPQECVISASPRR